MYEDLSPVGHRRKLWFSLFGSHS